MFIIKNTMISHTEYNSRCTASNTNREKYPKKYCPVTLLTLVIWIVVLLIFLLQKTYVIPMTPRLSNKATTIITTISIIVALSSPSATSINIFIITRAYIGTNADKNSSIFLIILSVYVISRLLL